MRRGDEPGLVRCQKQSGICGVASVAGKAQRYPREPLGDQRVDITAGTLAGQARLDYRRLELAWNRCVDADVVGRVFDSGYPR